MSSARGLMNMPNVQTSGIYFTYREEGVKNPKLQWTSYMEAPRGKPLFNGPLKTTATGRTDFLTASQLRN